MVYIRYHFVLFVIILSKSGAAPNRKRPDIGPCAGMGCLHGVLMHGDSEMGEDHAKEDLYKRLEREDTSRQQRQPIGPCNGKDCMEMINHGQDDPDAVHKMSEKIGPEPEKEQATVDMGKAMHGEEQVDHNARKTSSTTSSGDGKRPSVSEPEEILHHGETVNHDTPIGSQSEDIGDQGSGAAREMTSSGSGGEASGDKHLLSDEVPGVADLETVLHNGESVDHDAATKLQETEDGKKDKPSVVGATPSEDSNRISEGKQTKAGQDNEASEHVPSDAVHERHSAKSHHRVHSQTLDHGEHSQKLDHGQHSQTLDHGEHSGTLDPHGLIHGEHKTDAGGFSGREKPTEEIEGKKDDDSEAAFGFSFPYISDSIMNEIELLKRRYLPRFWSEGDELEDDPDDSSEVRVEDVDDEELSKNGDDTVTSETELHKNIKSITQVKHLPRQDDKEQPSTNRQRIEI